MSDERAANVVDQELGARVRRRRLELGMSQERLAELLGVTFQQVQKYEKGVNRIAASRLYDIAHALDMPAARFFEGLGGASCGGRAESFPDDPLATPGAGELVRLFATIESNEVRRRVIDLVRAMTAEKI